MPKYDYKCPRCNIIIEKEHKISETPDIRCDKCGSRMFIIITRTPTMIFVDNPNDPTGITWEKKHNRWFNNAEKIRIKERDKRLEAEKEKRFYSGYAQEMLKKGEVK